MICKAKKFMENGGICFIGPMVGYRTEDHTVPTNTALGLLEEHLGFTVNQLYPMSGSGTTGEAFGITAALKFLGCTFAPEDAHVLGVTKGGITPKEPFIIEKHVGKGKLVMLGVYPDGDDGEKMLKNMLEHYAAEQNILRSVRAGAGTAIIERHTANMTIIL